MIAAKLWKDYFKIILFGMIAIGLVILMVLTKRKDNSTLKKTLDIFEQEKKNMQGAYANRRKQFDDIKKIQDTKTRLEALKKFEESL